MGVLNILSVGDTFEKTYASGAGVKNFTFSKTSVVIDIAKRCGLSDINVQYYPDFAKDSLDMNESDRHAIADWCSHYGRSVVIHGTDTMLDTAKVIRQRNPEKVVVLTGAFLPARMRDSDAEFNLGGAIVAARVCSPGVYIAMHGEVFSWYKCRKNSETGHFELD